MIVDMSDSEIEVVERILREHPYYRFKERKNKSDEQDRGDLTGVTKKCYTIDPSTTVRTKHCYENHMEKNNGRVEH